MPFQIILIYAQLTHIWAKTEPNQNFGWADKEIVNFVMYGSINGFLSELQNSQTICMCKYADYYSILLCLI